MSNPAGRKKDAPTKPRKRPYEAFREFCEPLLSLTLNDGYISTSEEARSILMVPLIIWNWLYIDYEYKMTILEDRLDSMMQKKCNPTEWLSYVYLKEKRKENLPLYNYRFTKMEVNYNPEINNIQIFVKARK